MENIHPVTQVTLLSLTPHIAQALLSKYKSTVTTLAHATVTCFLIIAPATCPSMPPLPLTVCSPHSRWKDLLKTYQLLSPAQTTQWMYISLRASWAASPVCLCDPLSHHTPVSFCHIHSRRLFLSHTWHIAILRSLCRSIHPAGSCPPPWHGSCLSFMSSA